VRTNQQVNADWVRGGHFSKSARSGAPQLPWLPENQIPGDVAHPPCTNPQTKNMRGLRVLVGERGFEPPTPWSRTRCSTRLSHSPTEARFNRTRKLVEFAAEGRSGCIRPLDYNIHRRYAREWPGVSKSNFPGPSLRDSRSANRRFQQSCILDATAPPYGRRRKLRHAAEIWIQ
jgi:hypothetical protein